MNMDPYEVIGAFVDGERVDPDALKAALSTDDGRQYLVDIAILREMSNGDGATGHREMLGYRDIGVSGHRDAATMRRRWLAPGAAAAAVVVALAAGYAAGRHSAPTSSPDRQAFARAGANQPAPAPTSVIRLQPGVDWHEQTPRN
jgi:hypothetical protein